MADSLSARGIRRLDDCEALLMRRARLLQVGLLSHDPDPSRENLIMSVQHHHAFVRASSHLAED